ncbi:lytic transglycosylase domain-containing protein [Lutibacter sp.]|uniref:lytic transglycosylase domain-containing protein n=1 Tax=Lutibacter sp. TaxID=1925666 RepID=UPI002736D3F3|nr:lytic transglycosylase domain-containing protein [Lutibacter sp.]MDP3313095.1 lytic transglycosylase domain-containing protein [Lutibacter sp.]
MKTSTKIIGIISLLFISSLFIFSSKKDDVTLTNEKNTSETYQIKALKIPTNLNFAGERVPTEDEDVKERIDRELLVNTYWQSNTILLIKRANKYFPIIEPILKKNGIPDDVKYIALIESGLQNVTSPAGARGFWQIMKATAQENGLEVNDNVDERYHVEKSTEVACNYLNKAYKKFGNWTLAAASYNAGMSGISKKQEEQLVSNYYDLLLTEETKRYILRIVAIKEIVSNPEKYGYIYDQDDLYNLPPTKTIKVDSTITNLAKFSKDLGINYKIIKEHNPWLRENKLNNTSKKEYQIKIPNNTK